MLYVSAVVAASVIVSRSSDNYGDDRKLEKDICTSFSHAHTHKDDDDNLYITYCNDIELADVLSRLRDLKLPFLETPAGWPPAAVYAKLRDEQLVSGPILTVSWRGPSKPEFYID